MSATPLRHPGLFAAWPAVGGTSWPLGYTAAPRSLQVTLQATLR